MTPALAPTMDHKVVLDLAALLHPSGFARRSATVGCGSRLPAQSTAVDLILLSPTALEWRDRRWRAEALATIIRRLAPDGVLFAISPGRRQRHSIRRAIARSGLSTVEPLAVLPNRSRMRQITPLTPRALEHELVRVFPRAGAFAGAVAQFASRSRTLELLLPTVGYAARRSGSAPLMAWLAHAENNGSWLVRGSWRGSSGAAVAFRLGTGSSRASLVAKVTRQDAAEAEARALRAVAPRPPLDTVRAPKLLRSVRLGERLALVEEPLEGQPCSVWLARHPERLAAVLPALGRWLEEWAKASRHDAVLKPAEFEALVLAPARELTPVLEDSQPYLDWLADLGRDVIGKRVARTAAHRDLTMWNVLVSPSGRLGVLDWAESMRESLPLGDLAYSVVDAVAAVERYRSRPAAFNSCFMPGRRRQDAVEWLHRLAASLELSVSTQTLCFHACWLGHAVNELRQDGGQPGPFAAIAQRLASRRLTVRPRAEGS